MLPTPFRALLLRLRWIAILVICASVGMLSYQQWQDAQQALTTGRQVVVDVETMRITFNPVKAEMAAEAAADKSENVHAAEPVAPVEPEPAKEAVKLAEPEVAQEVKTATEEAAKEKAGEANTNDDVNVPAAPSHGKLAVMFVNLGLNKALTGQIIKLPYPIAMSFSPYASNLPQQLQVVKELKRDVFLDLPMETTQFPFEDPGPYALLKDAGQAKNLFRLKNVLSMAGGAQGLVALPSEVITHQADVVVPIMEEIARADKVFVYDAVEKNTFLPQEAKGRGLRIIPDYVLVDGEPNREAMMAVLESARKMAVDEQKNVLLVARPSPLSVREVESWLKELKQSGIQISNTQSFVQ